jgi:hypothetical protein
MNTISVLLRIFYHGRSCYLFVFLFSAGRIERGASKAMPGLGRIHQLPITTHAYPSRRDPPIFYSIQRVDRKWPNPSPVNESAEPTRYSVHTQKTSRLRFPRAISHDSQVTVHQAKKKLIATTPNSKIAASPGTQRRSQKLIATKTACPVRRMFAHLTPVSRLRVIYFPVIPKTDAARRRFVQYLRPLNG